MAQSGMAQSQRIAELQKTIYESKQELAELRRQEQARPVADHILTDQQGRPVHLSKLFGDREDLLVIHNMGTGCAYCTLWADELNGVLHHLLDRTAVVVVSPDPPAVQQRFAAGRGWKFPMASAQGSSFNAAMGYETPNGKPMPGVSAFHRDGDGNLTRAAHAPFGPGDDFCGVWHYLDLLHGGAQGWAPKFQY